MCRNARRDLSHGKLTPHLRTQTMPTIHKTFHLFQKVITFVHKHIFDIATNINELLAHHYDEL